MRKQALCQVCARLLLPQRRKFCSDCAKTRQKAMQAQWRAARPAYLNAWLASHPGKRDLYNARRHAKEPRAERHLCEGCAQAMVIGKRRWCPECGKHQARVNGYGISVVDFRAKLAAQKGQCEICGRLLPLQVDHDHLTGAVRGLLCGNCNKGIGMLGDSASRTERAAAYLKNYANAAGPKTA